MQDITGLSADLVPHREWALRRWFYAHPLWYYHGRADTHQLISDPKFYELVDPELRRLCHLLLDAGIQTTPSCQGHFYPIERFDHIWEELQREASCIRGEGLEVRDSESDTPHRFRDPEYRLPWPDFPTFLAAINAHQNQGYLGIVIPEQREGLARALRAEPYAKGPARIEHDPELSGAFGGETFNILVVPESPEQREGAWTDLTDHVERLLNVAA